jgi:hypothetical protein
MSGKSGQKGFSAAGSLFSDRLLGIFTYKTKALFNNSMRLKLLDLQSVSVNEYYVSF